MNSHRANLANLLTPTVSVQGGTVLVSGNRNRSRLAKTWTATNQTSILAGVATSSGLVRQSATRRSGQATSVKSKGPALTGKTSQTAGTSDGAAAMVAGGSFGAIVKELLSGSSSQSVTAGTGATHMPAVALDKGTAAKGTGGFAGSRNAQQSTTAAQAKTSATQSNQQAAYSDDAGVVESAASGAKPVSRHRQPAATDQQAAQVVGNARSSGQAAGQPQTSLTASQTEATGNQIENAVGQTVSATTNGHVRATQNANHATGESTPAEPAKVTRANRSESDPQPKSASPAGPKFAAEAKGSVSSGGSSTTLSTAVEPVAGETGQSNANSNSTAKGTDSVSAADSRNLLQAGATSEEVSVVNQVAQHLRAGNLRAGQQIVIRLNPPELGTVRLSLEAQGKDLRGRLEVDNPRALSEFQRETATLLSRLADSGINLRRMEIVLNDSSQRAGTEGFNSAMAEDQTRQQANSAGGQSPTEGVAIQDATTQSADTIGQAGETVQVSDESINVWM